LNGYAIRHNWTNQTWLDDTVAYAPQAAYIQHGTIRNNILFGQPMWRSRYEESLRQACLLPDLSLMTHGDLTEVGELGVNLSGGQKARINLARCIYSRARTVYMDDILSAVDAHTAQFIVNECIQGDLLKGRTVVLVTHHVGLCLPAADYVISIKDGIVDKACSAKDAKADLLIMPHQEDLPASPVSLASNTLSKDLIHDVSVDTPRQSNYNRPVYQKERMATGRVAKPHYMLVLGTAGGLMYWLVFAILYAFNEGFVIFRAIFLKHWSSDANPAHLNSNLFAYACLIAGSMVFGSIRWFWLYGIGDRGFYNRGSRLIHERLLDSICSATISWFEATPAGRIMNIFGQDQWRLDSSPADDFARECTDP
jgi:ABC-type multidrug transport system fused ATPase/permease subunit